MRVPVALFILAGATLAAGAAYHAGRTEGSADTRAAERDEQLKVNAVQIRALEPQLARLEIRKDAQAIKSDSARAEYSAARSRMHIVDTMSLQLDGELLKLPPPVIHTIASADVALRRDSLEKVTLEEWGAMWKHKAELLEQRVVILETSLEEERSARRRQRIRDIVTVGAIGGALGVILSRVQVVDVLSGPPSAGH